MCGSINSGFYAAGEEPRPRFGSVTKPAQFQRRKPFGHEHILFSPRLRNRWFAGTRRGREVDLRSSRAGELQRAMFRQLKYWVRKRDGPGRPHRRSPPRLEWQTSRSPCPHATLASMSVEMTLEIWKWPPLWTSCISTRPVGNDFQQPRGNHGNRHFHMSTIFTPYGGTSLPWTWSAGPGRRGKGERGDIVPVLQFGVRSPHVGFG